MLVGDNKHPCTPKLLQSRVFSFLSDIKTSEIFTVLFLRVEEFPAIHKLFPRADVKFIPDSGHWLHAEKPKEFSETVVEFLNECLEDHH